APAPPSGLHPVSDRGPTDRCVRTPSALLAAMVDKAFSHGSSCVGEVRTNRPLRYAEQLRDLAVSPALQVVEEEHLSLYFGQHGQADLQLFTQLGSLRSAHRARTGSRRLEVIFERRGPPHVQVAS